MSSYTARSSAGRRRRAHRLWPVGAAAILVSCNLDKALQVPDPDVVRPDAVSGVAALPVLVAGARADFQVAYSGGSGTTEGQINYAGLFTDEFIQTESFPTRTEVELREITRENPSTSALFLDLSRARAAADRAGRSFIDLDRNGDLGHSTVLNLAAYTYILFAENYCSGVPFSRLREDFSLEYGEPQTTVEMLDAAVARFDSAITIATASEDGGADAQLNLARIGKARALLDQGRFADAAATVAQVPTDFQYLVEHSSNSFRQNNGIWDLSNNQGRWGVADEEGGNGLPFRSGDVRIPIEPSAGFDGSDMFAQLKYPERETNVVLADGVEARLIEAEAAMRAGSAAQFIAHLNGIRADAGVRLNRDLQQNVPPGSTIDALLPPLTDPGTASGRADLLFQERAYWLYLTSHRLGDLRRLVRQYGRAASTVFPSGSYTSPGGLRSGTYGSDVNFPIPIEEGNNPNLPANSPGGCVDRNA